MRKDDLMSIWILTRKPMTNGRWWISVSFPMLILVAAISILTGYLMPYFGPNPWRAAVGSLILGTGLLTVGMWRLRGRVYFTWFGVVLFTLGLMLVLTAAIRAF